MSASDYLLYTGMFAAILITQLGTRRPDGKRLLLPVAITACPRPLTAPPSSSWSLP
jgi:hypothetical protein